MVLTEQITAIIARERRMIDEGCTHAHCSTTVLPLAVLDKK